MAYPKCAACGSHSALHPPQGHVILLKVRVTMFTQPLNMDDYSPGAFVGFYVLMMILGGCVTFCAQKFFIILTTAFAGSFLVVFGEISSSCTHNTDIV